MAEAALAVFDQEPQQNMDRSDSANAAPKECGAHTMMGSLTQPGYTSSRNDLTTQGYPIEGDA
eukprot:3142542-Prymnesium_polylepis.1